MSIPHWIPSARPDGFLTRPVALAVTGYLLVVAAFAAEPIPFAPMRYDEDFSYLRNEPRSTFEDCLKFIPLNDSESIHLTLGGEIREQYEFYHNADFGAGVQDHDGYLLQRYLLHGALEFGPQVRVFGELQSAFATGKTPAPSPVDEDRLDLHQGFIEFSYDEAMLRLGRQEISLGSQRLISKREGPNVRRTFDAARFLYDSGDSHVTAFVAKPVQTDSGIFDDQSEQARDLWGIYATLPVKGLPNSAIDFYYLGYQNDDGSFDQDTAKETRHSLGSRWFGENPAGAGNIDYNFEGVYQFGRFGSGSIEAWTLASDSGFTLPDLPFSPRFGFRADIGSGDRNPESADLQTFNPMFPKGDYFGESSLLGPFNFIDAQPSLGLQLTDDISLVARWAFFWRQSVDDGIYGPSGHQIRDADSTASRVVGSEASLSMEWAINRNLTAVAAYAHFFAGEFLKETGPAEDVDYVLLSLQFKF